MRRWLIAFFVFVMIILKTIFAVPTISFVSPTPYGNISEDYIYANLSTSGDEHYSFVDFDNDLILWMRMDDVSGTTVLDKSSYGNDGSLENGTAIIPGKYGNASQGDGIDNYIHVPDSSAFDSIADTDEMTVCAWTYRKGNSNAYGASQGVLGQYWASGIHGYNRKSFAIAEGITAPNGGYGFFVSPNGASWQDAHSDSSVALNEWHHLCGVVESSGIVKLYIDGVVQSDTGSVSGIYNADAPFTVGTYFYAPNGHENDSTLFFNGDIDEVLLFNRGLSQEEIRAIFNSSEYASFANNYTGLADGEHKFIGYAVDDGVDSISRTVETGVEEQSNETNDTIAPEIEFVFPTEDGESNLSRDYIQVNVSASDDVELSNVTIYLYDDSGLIDSQLTTSSPNYINFTNLSNGDYYFNATALDNSSNSNSTETRAVTINVSNESNETNESSLEIEFISPTPSGQISEDYVYVNTSSSGTEHYSFVDFDNDLVGWWRLENNSFVDSSGNGNDGSAVNGGDVASSKYGNGFQGDGNGKYVTIDDSSSIDTIATNNEITVCSWVYPYSNDNDHGAAQAVLGQWQSGGNDKSFAFLEGLAGQGVYAFYVSGGGSAWEDAQADSALTLNTWAHLCGTSDGTTVKLYVDGVLQTDTGTMSGVYDADTNFTIGTYNIGSSLFYNGSIDEVLLFNRELSLSEIRAIYNSSAYASFANNYTSLDDGNHTFTAYAVNGTEVVSVERTMEIIENQSNETGDAPVISVTCDNYQENNFNLTISTDVDVDSCWFVENESNTTMLSANSTNFYYNLGAGEYDLTFYCENENGTGNLTDSFEFRKYVSFYDSHYTNSQGLEIYFDFNYNYTNDGGILIITSDTWSSDKDSSTLHDAEAKYMPRGYAVASVETRGKGSSDGSPDAYGYCCMDIYELAQYILSTPEYNQYVNSSKGVYITGASGAGGRTGVCTAKYPDFFVSGHSTVGVLNLSLWWETAGSGDVSAMESRVGCGFDECPEAYQARDAGYLGYNTLSPMSVEHPIDDSRVTVGCSRDYNASLVSFNKIVNYTEPSSGGHRADWTPSYEWFETYTSIPILPSSGDLRIGGFVHTKNFSIFLDESTVDHMAYVDYNLSDYTFNLTTKSFDGDVNFTMFDLTPDTNYTVDGSNCIESDSNGDLFFVVDVDSYSSLLVDVDLAVNCSVGNETIAPEIEFVSPTEDDESNLSRDYILVNVSASDDNLANITIYLYDDFGLVNSDTDASDYNFENFTGLNNGTYYFNATAYDSYGNSNSTETRSIFVGIQGNETNETNETFANLTIDFVSPTPSGQISEDYIYVNSSSNGTEHYSFVDFDNDLVGFWRMDNRNSSYVIDESGNGNDGSIENGTSFASGKYGDGFVGDGVDNYLHVDDSLSIDSIANNNEMTVCAWTYRTSNSNSHGAHQGVLGQYWASGIHGYNRKSFAIAEGITAPDGGYGFFVSRDGSAWQDAHSDATVALNEWHHLCGVVENSGIVKLYIDGVVQSDTGSVSGIYNADAPFTIGTYWYSGSSSLDSTLFFNGSVDEVLLFNRGLSQSEIRAIYNSSEYASFANNYTNLDDGNHTFTAYAVNGTLESVERTVETGYVEPDYSNIYVGENYNSSVCSSLGYVWQSNCFESIQDGIDNVEDNGTVYVANGNYDEPLNIENRTEVRIVGEDLDNVLIKANSTLDWNVASYGSSRQAVLRIVNSVGIEVENITFDYELVRDNMIHGFLIWDSESILENNVFRNMSVNDSSGIYYEVTGYVRAVSYNDSNRAEIIIKNNDFIDTGRLGVVTHGYVNSTIENNVFTKNVGDFGYAMEIGSQSVAGVIGNEISGFNTSALSDGSDSAGIYIENSFTSGVSETKEVYVEDNVISNCEYGFYIGNEFNGYAGDVDVIVTSKNNSITNCIEGGFAVTDEDASLGSSVTLNSQGDSIINNGESGFYVYSQGDGDLDIEIINGEIKENNYGLLLTETAIGSSYNLNLNKTKIENNSYGVYNNISNTSIDARFNWWGDSSGPGGEGIGNGNNVSVNVEFEPWYNEEEMTNLNYIPINNVSTMDLVIINSSLGNNYTDEDLACYVQASDLDGDNVSYSGYWYKNGVQDLAISTSAFAEGELVQVSVLDSGNTSVGDVWSCEVQAYDGENYSSYLSSVNLSVSDVPDNPAVIYMNGPTFTVTFDANITDDNGITNVSLLGNWTGNLEVDQTNSSGINNVAYAFTKQFTSGGTYLWAFKVYDSAGQLTESINKTFTLEFM